MEYRSLGRTGVQVSPLCLGCMNFGWGTEEDVAIRMIHRAMDAGINFLDTANVYARGTSEEVTGKAISVGGRRDRVFLATKFHGRMDDQDPNAWGNHRYHVRRQCEESLRRLNTDRIDLYQVHRPQPLVPIDETLRALDDLVRAGKVLYIGTSTYAAWQLVEALWAAETLGTARFVCEQPPLNVLDRRIERELLPYCRTYGVAVIPWSPLAGGLLTGKYARGAQAPAGSRYEKGMPDQRATDRAFDAVEGVRELASAKGCTMTAFSLAWCASRPGVTSPIIGPRTPEQLEENLKAVEVTVTDDDARRVDELVPPGTHVSEFYTADFGPNARWH
ncbi:MAG: aldo/keto reductase [Chthonomonadales bacterium]|nr:aldo/keto reductase [Chthonomonadales bacterium]